MNELVSDPKPLLQELAAKQQYFKAAYVSDGVTQFSEAKRLARLESFEYFTNKEDSDSNDSAAMLDSPKVSKSEAGKLAANNIKWFEWVAKRLYCSKAELKFFKIELCENYLTLILAWYQYKVRNHLACKIFGKKYHQAYKKEHDYLFTTSASGWEHW